MDAKSKKQLEKMAHAMCDRLSDSPCGRAYHAMYITGAEAAWTLAVEWERKRCAEIAIMGYGENSECVLRILTPEEVKT